MNLQINTPKYLTVGDRIAIVSTARKITPEEVEPAIAIFNSWGLEVIPGSHLYSSFNQFAGPDSNRLADLQRMLDDDSIRAIICSRGGYGTVRIIDQIDFRLFVKNPKWIVGYSDATVLHSHIHRHFGIETMHAIMPVNFPGKSEDNLSISTLKTALFGEMLVHHALADNLNRQGIAEGQLVGGNLSMLYSLTGTNSDINTSDKILFLEDLDEYLYHIDRMMMNLKRSGKLAQLSGLIVGGMTEMKDNEVPFGQTANEIIAESVKEYDYPVCFNFPAGHLEDNRALIFGRKINLSVGEKVILKF